MKQTGIISVDHEPGDAYPETDTDWAAVEAITDEEIRAAALSDPDSVPVPVYDTPGLIRLVNVKRLRERLGLTQEEFAATYRIPVGTLRDWEQARKNPDAPARAYLMVIARNPQAVAEWLKPAA
ncbi:MAG: helix-turn-helix domain-containing protein [Terracidiphilus sp.]|jgi:putative transcriptional regulator